MRARHYGDRTLYLTEEEVQSRTCPTCLGPKTANAGLCWRCAAAAAGRSAGKPGAQSQDFTNRAHNGLMRAWSEVENRKVWLMPTNDRPSFDWLMRWAAEQSDETLMRGRNVGRKTIAWIRGHSPTHRMGDPIWGQVE